MPIAAKLDEFGKPAWIALMILGFIVWWPLGLAVLAFMHLERTNGLRKTGRGARQDGAAADGQVRRMSGWLARSRASSGNRAFDEYRAETLRRLEEEQREFREFLERLRFAKDKTEFDQFMAERRNRRIRRAAAADLSRPSFGLRTGRPPSAAGGLCFCGIRGQASRRTAVRSRMVTRP